MRSAMKPGDDGADQNISVLHVARFVRQHGRQLLIVHHLQDSDGDCHGRMALPDVPLEGGRRVRQSAHLPFGFEYHLSFAEAAY
jgi:hypothetical protein